MVQIYRANMVNRLPSGLLESYKKRINLPENKILFSLLSGEIDLKSVSTYHKERFKRLTTRDKSDKKTIRHR